MRILICLTYYRPHYSGLTIYTERLAKALANRGHHVSILTSRFNESLSTTEVSDGVTIHRLNVLMRISKGVIMPSMPARAYDLIRQADVVNLHVPQLDAAPDAVLSRILGRPVVLTYHCDLHLPKGFIHGIANQVSHLANHVSAGMANVIITNTRDYAENSPFLTKYLDKVGIINPPAELPDISKEDLERFQQDWNIDPSQPVIGMAARLASEKGVEYLVEAMPKILEKHKGARVLFVGQYENLLGEEKYAQRLTPLIDKLKGHWTFLGNVNNKDLTAFYKSCDLTVLPSTNPTESFGMVQIESMICGVPVVASNMPGIRHPVQSTGMGLIVPAKNSTALANAILEILDHPHKYQGDSDFIRKLYSPDSVAEQYEQYFVKIIKNRKTKSKNINHGNSHG